ncbi:MAG TPA: amylo-alpha-1,6-glucosidase [Thermoanaerobaculia bacterium]|jgi:predicted glycogen debranching enzyme|nr:amylo-alpha-1,6-glucosidase [Thermoanaerobaculia bacterium]
MIWRFNERVTRDFARASRYEWLETNGLGGWASSTVSSAHTRRYHGLLVAATEPPVGRKVLLSRLEETLHVGAAGGDAFALAANQFPGAIHPRGCEHLSGFRRDLFPVFTFEAGGVRIEKTIVAVDGEPLTLVLYEVLAAPGPFLLELRPFYAGRDYHALVHANDAVHREGSWSRGVLRYRSYDGLPEVFLSVPGAEYRPSLDWYYNYEYAREAERGLDSREDLFTPGALTVTLGPGARLGVVAATEDPAGRDPFLLFAGERERRERLLDPFANAGPLGRTLALAADQFLVRRKSRDGGLSLWTVLAGYPWFTDWGRDTMIALPGLCLATGRHAEARGILRAFAGAVDQGMLPNRFPDGGESPEYNTADASLWYFVAIHRYLGATGDAAFARELLPVLRDIHTWHERGTRHGIHEDTDGLLHAGEPGWQLTWMDARVDGREVTPRQGKPVEIEALWVNALQILAGLERRLGDAGTAAEAARLDGKAERARLRFGELFWNPASGYLYDCIDGDERDASLRPNQLLALSLPFPLLAGERAESVLRAVERQLLTPVGLRTLAPDDPRYRPRYEGSPAERDGAYHQGTVWPWLLGPYLTALVQVRGEAGQERARAILEAFTPHLWDAGIGTVGEIYDGDPPHLPRGCVAQAWSVGELLRAAGQGRH